MKDDLPRLGLDEVCLYFNFCPKDTARLKDFERYLWLRMYKRNSDGICYRQYLIHVAHAYPLN